MELIVLLLFWNLSGSDAATEHVQMKLCSITIKNHAPEFLLLRYQERF